MFLVVMVTLHYLNMFIFRMEVRMDLEVLDVTTVRRVHFQAVCFQLQKHDRYDTSYWNNY